MQFVGFYSSLAFVVIVILSYMDLRTTSKKLLLVFLIFFTSLVFSFNLLIDRRNDNSGYTELARSFLNGRVYLMHISKNEDYAFYNSKHYLHQGPFPALVLLPLVATFDLIGIPFYQSYFQIVLFLGTFYLIYRVAKRFGFSKEDSSYLAFAFCFASVYQSLLLISLSSFLAQIFCVFLLFLVVNEFLGRRRYFVIGVICSFVFATRFTAGLISLFFVVELVTNKEYTLRKRIVYLGQFLVPIIMVGFFLILYNYARFGNVFDFGYTKAIAPSFPEKSTSFLFNIKNIPSNFYTYFFKTLKLSFITFEIPYLQVVFPGTSFFITSPVFLHLFKLKLKNRLEKLFIFTIAIILLILLSYKFSGWIQVGPRYMLDIMPFMFILLLYSFHGLALSVRMKSLILVSSVFNFYLFLTVFLPLS